VLRTGTIIAGKYRIDAKIGAGGMGTVFRATDLRLQREIAIKVHHPWKARVDRLSREARLLARLSHPNVVTVMEVGTHEGAPFVAMEYVAGGNARDWVGLPDRTWQQIVDIYVQGARGLAAAHAVGIVHRDFKPDNLLVSANGRALVADFGLANLLHRPPSEPRAPVLATADGPAPSDELDVDTASQGLLGTPDYAAPEQFRSAHVDGRADQFALCTALFEALYGVLPYPRPVGGAPRGDSLDGDVVIPRRRRGVPQWVDDVLLRGLSRPAEGRFDTMQALADALSRPPPRWRAFAWLGAGLALVVGLPAFTPTVGWFATTGDRRCAEPRTTDHDRILAALEAEFDGSDPATKSRGNRILRRLEQRDRDWTHAWTATCAAQHDESASAQGDTLHRLDCLDEHSRHTDALLQELVVADPESVLRVLRLLERAGEPLSCLGSPASVESIPAGEDDPQDVGARVALVRERIEAGRNLEAVMLADAIVADVELLADEAHLPSAVLARGEANHAAGRERSGFEDLQRALHLAEARGDAASTRRAAVELALASHPNRESARAAIVAARELLDSWPRDASDRVRLLAREADVEGRAGGFAEAHALLDQAESLTTQASVPDDVTAFIWRSRSRLASDNGDFDAALAHATRYRELLAGALGETHYRVGDGWAAQGSVHGVAGHVSDARDDYRRALALYERPGLGISRAQAATLVELAAYETLLNETTAALEHLGRATACFEQHGLENPRLLASMHETRGLALLDLNRSDDAYDAFATSASQFEALLGPTHSSVANALTNLALAARSSGRLDEAKAALERVIQLQDEQGGVLAAKGANALGIVGMFHAYGFLLLDLGEIDEAERQFRRAALGLDGLVDGDHPDQGWPALGLGRVAMHRGRPAEALGWFARASAVWAVDGDTSGLADLAASKAEALWQLGRRREAVEGARAALLARPDHGALAAWLAEHDRP
jgi:tetratricopeptide (TPR) repeat protein